MSPPPSCSRSGATIPRLRVVRARVLALAAILAAVGLAAVHFWWLPGVTAAVVVAVAVLGERYLAPLTADERADWPGRPLLGLGFGDAREGLALTWRVVAWSAPVCAVLALAIIAWVRSSGLSEAELDRLPRNVRELDALPEFLWLACIVAPLIEELVWRGLVQQHLARALGAWPAIFLSGVLFWTMHWIPAGGPTPANQLVGGWVIAWTWHRTRGLLAPVLLHAAGNAAIAGVNVLWIVRPEWLRALLGFS